MHWTKLWTFSFQGWLCPLVTETQVSNELWVFSSHCLKHSHFVLGIHSQIFIGPIKPSIIWPLFTRQAFPPASPPSRVLYTNLREIQSVTWECHFDCFPYQALHPRCSLSTQFPLSPIYRPLFSQLYRPFVFPRLFRRLQIKQIHNDRLSLKRSPLYLQSSSSGNPLLCGIRKPSLTKNSWDRKGSLGRNTYMREEEEGQKGLVIKDIDCSDGLGSKSNDLDN